MKRNDIIIGKEYKRNLIPMVLSILGGTINTFVDSVFVSQTVGTVGLAAVNLALPVYLVMCVIGALIGGGASVESSHRMGQDKAEEANLVYNNAWTMSFIAGGILTVLGLSLCRPLSLFLTQDGELYSYVYTYIFYTVFAAIPNLLGYLVTNYLQLEGKTRNIYTYMATMVIADFVLDYIMMVPLNMGMMGAALASGIACVVSCAYGFYCIESGYSNYYIHWKLPTKNTLIEIIRNGSPIAMGNGCDAFKALVVNFLILSVYGTVCVETQSILSAMSELSICITSGIAAAAGPMIGIFYVARENENIRSLIRMQMIAGIQMSAIFAVVICVLHKSIAGMYFSQTVLFIPLLCLGLSGVCDIFNSVYCNYINKCEKPGFANMLTVFRRFVSPVLILFVLSRTEISADFIWIYLPLAAILTAGYILISAWVYQHRNNKIKKPVSGFLLLDDHLVKENKILDFSIEPTNENICDAAAQISEFCELNNMSVSMTMKLGMAIEEILTVIVAKNEKLESVDLRVFSLEGNTGLRIRCGGIRYNPFESGDDDDFLMGVNMLVKLSDTILYTYVLGMNNISISIKTGED